jgi:DNA-binding protein Fis
MSDKPDISDMWLRVIVKNHVCKVVDMCEGNLTEAAFVLGIGYRTLMGMRKRWGIKGTGPKGPKKRKFIDKSY